jgi:hypothetical protein
MGDLDTEVLVPKTVTTAECVALRVAKGTKQMADGKACVPHPPIGTRQPFPQQLARCLSSVIWRTLD